MAISNPVTDGQATPAVGPVTTLAITTTAAVPADSKIWVVFSYFAASATAPTVAGGGLTWTVDSTTANGSSRCGLAWADAPAGLASSSTITLTIPSGSSVYHQSMYATGAGSGAATARNSGTTATAAWSSGSVAVPSGSVLIGVGDNGDASGGNSSNTPSGGNTEVHDQFIAGDGGTTSCYQLGTGASIAASGTFNAANITASVAAVFAADGAATPVFRPSRMPLGV